MKEIKMKNYDWKSQIGVIIIGVFVVLFCSGLTKIADRYADKYNKTVVKKK